MIKVKVLRNGLVLGLLLRESGKDQLMDLDVEWERNNSQG